MSGLRLEEQNRTVSEIRILKMDHIESSGQSWMMRMPQIFNVSQFRQMMAGTPIYGYRHGGVSRDYHDIDIDENREDESNIIFSPSLEEIRSQTNVNSPNTGRAIEKPKLDCS